MTALEIWLQRATRCLSVHSAAQVRSEIQEHYESARENAIANGATLDEADRTVVSSLGDARIANRQYRKVLLTATEARILCDVQWESRVVCARPWLVWLFRVIPAAALSSAAIAFVLDQSGVARLLLVAGVVVGVLIAAPTLPIYTPLRARIYRCLKWPAIILATGLAFGSGASEWFGVLAVLSIGFTWTEWIRHSIRRKLPVAEWPKQLHL